MAPAIYIVLAVIDLNAVYVAQLLDVVFTARTLDVVFTARTLDVVFVPVVVGRDLRTANPVVSVLALPPLLDADHRDHRHDRRGAGHVQPDQGVHLGGGEVLLALFVNLVKAYEKKLKLLKYWLKIVKNYFSLASIQAKLRLSLALNWHGICPPHIFTH